MCLVSTRDQKGNLQKYCTATLPSNLRTGVQDLHAEHSRDSVTRMNMIYLLGELLFRQKIPIHYNCCNNDFVAEPWDEGLNIYSR